MPNGVDLEFFSPDIVPAQQPAHPTVVFTGAMDYWPNVEGICWFVANVWPVIRRQLPETMRALRQSTSLVAWRCCSSICSR
jgi:hypothetical protein